MAKPYSAIPKVRRPEDYIYNIGRYVAQYYEQYGPIFRSDLLNGPGEVLFLVGPEANRFVLSTNRLKFSHHIGWGQQMGVIEMFGNGLLTMDGAEHAEHRRMMNPAFAIGYMDRYLPIMNRVIRERTAAWLMRDDVDVYEEARKITFDVAAQALAGLKAGTETDRFRQVYSTMLTLGMVVSTPEEWQRQFEALRRDLYGLLLPKIRERRANPTDDVLGMLVTARDDKGQLLSDEQLIAHVNILLIAGHETSTSLVAWLLCLLSQNPDYTARLLEEQASLLAPDETPTLDKIKQMKLLDNALSEAERLYPPVASGPRGVVEDFEFEGYHVPAGTFVFYSISGAHMIPGIFPDPERFDPDRFASPREEDKKTPYALIGFGGGPRICIGLNFASVEIKALTSHVLRSMTFDLVPGQQLVQIYHATGMPLNGIRMRFRERQPAPGAQVSS